MLSSYEQKLKQSSRLDECKKFFDNMLAGIEVDSNIIPDEITDAPEKNGGIIRYDIADYADAAQIAAVCKKLGITENTLFLGAFSYALAKQSGQELAVYSGKRQTPSGAEKHLWYARSYPAYVHKNR